MAESIFNGEIHGRNVVAAPHAAHGGTNNFYFADNGQSKPRQPFSTVPFRPDPDFVERPAITAWLRGKCAQPASRAALVGLGGIGKSQLAVHYAHIIRQHSPNTYVFWVHASTNARFEEAYRDIAERLQLPGRSDPNVDVMQLVYRWLSTEENGPWLIVVDNADDMSVFYPTPNRGQSMTINTTTERPLASLLPQSSNGMILVTSRSKEVAARLVGSQRSISSIQAMDEHQALQLLRKKLQESHDADVAPDLAQALEYMPLAITQAAAYILQQAPRMSPSTYLTEFRRSKKRKTSLLSRNMGDLQRDSSASNSIVTTWQITFDKIRQQRQSAADLLVFMSFFNPQGTPEWVIRSYQHSRENEEANLNTNFQESQDDSDDSSHDDADDAEFQDDLSILREFSLVVPANKDVFEMHALVQFCTRNWLSSSDTRIWRRKFLQVMSREFPSGNYENWAKCRELDPHVELLIEKKPKNEEDAKDWAHLLTSVGWYKWSIGLYEVANRALQEAVEVRQKILGVQGTDTLLSIAILALVLQYQGKYEEAEQMNRQALDGREKVLGKEHPDTLTSVSNLALVLQYQGKYEEAEQMNRQALDGYEKALGKEHPYTLTSVSNLALVLRYQGKYKEAEQMNRQALDSYEKALGKEHPDTLTSVSNLALVLQYQGKYEEAEQMNRQALDGYEKALGKEHPDTLTSVSNLALVLQYQGKYKEAEQMNRQALDGYEKVLGKEHPNTLTSVYCLVYLVQKQGRLEEANELDDRAYVGYVEVRTPPK